jgi:hypothetical protein
MLDLRSNFYYGGVMGDDEVKKIFRLLEWNAQRVRSLATLKACPLEVREELHKLADLLSAKLAGYKKDIAS